MSNTLLLLLLLLFIHHFLYPQTNCTIHIQICVYHLGRRIYMYVTRMSHTCVTRMSHVCHALISRLHNGSILFSTHVVRLTAGWTAHFQLVKGNEAQTKSNRHTMALFYLHVCNKSLQTTVYNYILLMTNKFFAMLSCTIFLTASAL